MPSPPGRGDCKSRNPDLRRFLRLLWQASPRSLAARLEPEESLPGTSETIPGCEKGEEESPGREHGNRPGERSPPRTRLQLPATVSSAGPGSPLPSLGERVVPSGRPFPGSFTFTSGAAGASGGRGKGSLSLAVLPLLTRLVRRGRRRRLLLSRTSSRRARLPRTRRRRSSRPTSRRRFPRNPGWMESTLNKSVVRHRTHLGQR